MKQKTNRWDVLLICVVLVLTTAGLYWQVDSHEFVTLDDLAYVGDNEQVLNGLTREGFLWAFKTNMMGNWHPLTWLSLMMDCQFFQNNARACHITNVLFHIANTLLLFWVLKQMTGNVWPSGFVAAAFALHPLHVESVAWVAERKDVLSTFFWMLTMAAYVRYAEHPSFTRYLPIILFFALGLMAKPMLVTLPFVLLLLDYWPLGRLQLGQSGTKARAIGRMKLSNASSVIVRLVAEKVPFFILTAISCGVTYLAQQSVRSVGQIALLVRMANAVLAYSKYVWLMFWPAKLAVFYPYPHAVPIAVRLGSAILLLLVSVAVILLLRRRPYLVVGWLWYLGTLLPVIGLVQIGAQAMADRYTYVPLTGLFIMIAWAGADLVGGMRYRKIVLAVAAVVVLLTLGASTWFQVGHWRNSVTLYEHTLAVTKSNYLAHNNLGAVLSRQNRLNDAIEHYKQALQINPGYQDAIINLGMVLIRKGRVDETIKHYREYLGLEPADYRIYRMLGDALVLRQKIRAHYRLGAKLTVQDKYDLDQAVERYKEALQLKPDYFQAHYNLAEVLERQGELENAIKHYRETLRINPGHIRARQALQALKAALAKRNKSRQLKHESRKR